MGKKRRRRSFSPEFKAEAVRVVRESGKSVSTVARELDLTETALRGATARRAPRRRPCGQARALRESPGLSGTPGTGPRRGAPSRGAPHAGAGPARAGEAPLPAHDGLAA